MSWCLTNETIPLQVNNDPGNKYNIPLINCLVLYVGMQAIAYIQNKGMSTTTSTIAHSSHMDIFQNLAVDLDTEGMVATSRYGVRIEV